MRALIVPNERSTVSRRIAPDSIVIDAHARRLYYILPRHRAYAYDISVGREGFAWTGTEKVSRRQAWPDWYPPEDRPIIFGRTFYDPPHALWRHRASWLA